MNELTTQELYELFTMDNEDKACYLIYDCKLNPVDLLMELIKYCDFVDDFLDKRIKENVKIKGE